MFSFPKDHLQEHYSARTIFWGNFIGGFSVVLIILLIRKEALGPEIRLFLTAAFFLGLISFFWSLGQPMINLMSTYIEAALEDVALEVKNTANECIGYLAKILRGPVFLLQLGLILLFLQVLAAWPLGNFLLPLKGSIFQACLLVFVAIPLLLYADFNQFISFIVLWEVFQDQVRNSPFRMATLKELEEKYDFFNQKAVKVNGAYSFNAGGINWNWSDFTKNGIVFGQSGSGKTITVLNALLDGLLSSANGENGSKQAAALILDPKGDYRDKISQLCLRLGRSDDLLILNPNDLAHSVYYNPFDCPDDALEISDRFSTLMKLMGMKNTQDSFFIDNAKLFIQNAIDIIRATQHPSNPASFVDISDMVGNLDIIEARVFILFVHKFIQFQGLDVTDEKILEYVSSSSHLASALDNIFPQNSKRPYWLDYFTNWFNKDSGLKRNIASAAMILLSAKSVAIKPNLEEGSDALIAANYMLNKWFKMPNDTRNSVISQINPMIEPFVREPYRTMFSGKSTVNLGDILDKGKILYIYMPIDDRSSMSQTINTLIKLEYSRQVLLRKRKTRPSLFLCDEFQTFYSSDDSKGDAYFFERSRESFHANLVATQNLNSLYSIGSNEATVKRFLGNCAVKLFLRNDVQTNQYASDVFGQYSAKTANISRVTGQQTGWQCFKRSGISITVTIQNLPCVSPEKFSQLKTPDQLDKISYSEAYLHMGSRNLIEMRKLRFKVHTLSK